MAIYRAFLTLGFWTMASRILGFVRDVLIASVVGASLVADVFFVAFKFPNFFRRIFAEGAFNSAFVPLFAEHLAKNGLAAAKQFAAQVNAIMVSVLTAFILLALLLMPWLMILVAPGFKEQPEKFQLVIELTQITFPYLLFMALLSLLGGMLNALDRFAATASAPIGLNLILIAVLLLVRDGVVSSTAHALAWGVCLSGVIQFLWLVFACHRAGLLFRLPYPKLSPEVKRLLRLMLPGVIGAGVVHINLVVDVILATFLAEGSVSWLYYADRINQFPLGVVGVAIGVALLPALSRNIAEGKLELAISVQNRAIELCLVLCIPASAAFLVLAEPIAVVLFQRGEFMTIDSKATAQALTAFAFGLPAFVLIKAFSPGFFARKDTITPVKIAAISMILNVIVAVFLMQFLAHVGIALATSLTAWINVFALAAVLIRRGYFRFDINLLARLPRIVFSTALMAAGLMVGVDALSSPLAGSELSRSSTLLGLIICGGSIYLVTIQVTGAFRFSDFRNRKGQG